MITNEPSIDFQIKIDMNLPSDEQLKNELALYHQLQIPSGVLPQNIDMSRLQQRSINYCFESFSNLPQNIFLFKQFNQDFVGRKTVSCLKVQGVLEELNCSQIQAHMLLGLLKETQISEDGIHLWFSPLEQGEKLYLFDLLFNDTQCNVSYPFVYLLPDTFKERRSPDDGWKLNPLRAANLGRGEQIIRDYTVSFLAQFDMTDKHIFDPACSTGQFLSTIKKTFPLCHTVGQDLSQQMVDYAKAFVDEIYCGDAINPQVQKESVDFLFLRFLNSEVTSRAYAYQLFKNLLPTCKPNSYIILFGHTPVLLSYHWLTSLGLSVVQTLGRNDKNHSIFQYYVLQKK
jgi:hypothetical protein